MIELKDLPAMGLKETTDWSGEPAASLASGTIFGNKYKLIEQIGRGGMGVVWQAKDQVADRLVALKFVPNELRHFEAVMQKVRETFKKVHALQHQSICPLYTLESDEHFGYYLVMKYLEGETLDAYVLRKAGQSKVLPLNQVVAVLSRVATALDYAHQNGVIHRDIKPSNIFLVKSTNKIHVQIIDFGLADEIRTSLTCTGQMRSEASGTRPYMAPEQWRGRTQSAATDQYALAVVAYELLAGHVPFRGGDVELLRLVVMNEKPAPIPTISDSANAVLLKALAKDSGDRFSTCCEFIAALGGAWTPVWEKNQKEEKAASFSLSHVPRWAGVLAGCLLLLVFMLGSILWGMGSRNKTVSSDIVTKTVEAPSTSPPITTSSPSSLPVESVTLPDLMPFHPPGNWAGPLVVSHLSSNGFTTPLSSVTPDNELYVYYAFINDGDARVADPFSILLTIEGERTYMKHSDQWPGMPGKGPGNWYRSNASVPGPWNVGTLAPGTYTLTMTIDPEGKFAESNKDNNIHSLTFTVADVAK